MNSSKHLNILKKQRGATLIEALISLLIFSIGLLGIAGLVMSSLAQQKNAQGRTEGAVFAADIAEQMRANVPALEASGYISNDGGKLIVNYEDAKKASEKVTERINTCDTNATVPCTAIAMATNDYNNWLLSIKQTLPSGTGLIQRGTEPTARTITVVWDAKASSQTDDKFKQVDNTNNCPASLALSDTQKATFRCVTVPFMP
jgi:type IV pilus assembly protein PilV